MTDWPEGVGRHVLAEVGSTMVEARSLAANAPLWLLARKQTAARGRRGRAWEMPDGNFAATIVMRPQGPVSDWALRSFTMSLALREAVDALTGRGDILSLKWPNDVLCQGRKLVGILLESDGEALCIGVGVNLVAAPANDTLEETALPAIALQEATGQRIPPEALLDALAAAFARWEAILVEEGFEAVRAAWLSHATGLDRPVTARMPGRTVAGRFEGIDGNGAIVLDTGAGRVTLAAADIHFA
ncbi:MAG: biotin--[acetyl-CoA-carboxylase] ligase [Pseudomonadota bacterium]